MRQFNKELENINNKFANMFKGIGNSKSFSITTTSKNSFNNIDNIDFKPIKCQKCNTEHIKKIGWLKKNPTFNCICGEVRFLIKIVN